MHRRQMLKYLAAGTCVAALGSPRRAISGRTFAAVPKSVWVWRTPLSESAELRQLVREHDFRTVFYSVPPAGRVSLFGGGKREEGAIQGFREEGVSFYAVSGDPAWCRRGRLMPRAVADLLDFQKRGRLFDGLCLDVEPHALPEWKTGARDQVAQGYLDLLGGIRRASLEIKLPLTAAMVPFYANHHAPGGAGESLLQSAAALVDEVVMMGYRDAPSNALRLAAKSLDQLDAAGRPWWFGVSTHQKAPQGVSYAGSNFDRFKAAMIEIDTHLGSHGRFYRGIAINDYPSLTTILRR